jgi:hypothetical protein
MGTTIQEWLLKVEQDMMNARAENEQLRAIQDYNIMMGSLDDPSGYEEQENEVE